ncbi:MAG TPA: SDR family NAD(P)-dependent oxidoreductase [Paracoccaceae bacterium]|nr:SDR family NAD(P)-dependent oxidoreductase [Paracoccaceae bacterium]
MSLQGMRILVTGASSGIGAHIVRYLSGQGASVVATARRVEALEALAAECGEDVSALALDVGDAAAVPAAVDEAARRMGGLDGVFNNAGTAWGGRAMEMPPEDWDRVIDINLNAVFRVAQAAARVMAGAGGGSILNTGSVLGYGTGTGVAAYSASKAGVIHLTRSLALEWARHDIRVNALAPGYFPTEMTTGWLESEKGGGMVAAVPMRRAGRLHELEGPVELLLGPKGSYITGSTLVVDGGHLCRSL